MRLVVADSEAHAAFQFRSARGGKTLELAVQPLGSRAAPAVIWTRRFESRADRDVMLAGIAEEEADPVFLGRLTMAFGAGVMDELAETFIAAAVAEQLRSAERARETARKRLIVHLQRYPGKHGRHVLALERLSSEEADWSITYDRSIERDRLCDWMRWQKDRFLEFLDHAAEHGSEALTRLLLDEMFATERRVKKEGRGAGGVRPLRMWRGD
ncbi:hypothetical protein [Sphingomonas adhaesiva]|uniref:Uncharacterized protein n=1 Tax=Sphingomonas adhaesiva TaxID=28212 RepID=A0A2A4I4W7_9SPHN|nr:hypothetical protein [Sphingomonas adhaesiva]PCG13084.1 hypothetical protein COA07_16360 [Sphingomonas adhaesiva]